MVKKENKHVKSFRLTEYEETKLKQLQQVFERKYNLKVNQTQVIAMLINNQHDHFTKSGDIDNG